jgi:DNA-binding XRE family transcriptional regulator
MQIECPGCRTRADVERDALTAQSFKWLCPECRRHWQIRTVFFEQPGGPAGDEWRKVAKRLRLQQGMTQEQLGQLLGVTAAYISHIEGGKRSPRTALCRRILEALGAHEEAARL